MGAWFALDALLLIAGIIAVALSQLWRTPNILMNMVLSNADLTGSYSICYEQCYSRNRYQHQPGLSWVLH